MSAEFVTSEQATQIAIDEISRLRSDLSASRAECEALRADAERYRFLRNPASRDHAHHSRRALTAGCVDWGKNLCPEHRGGPLPWSASDLTNEDLDTAIDHARTALEATK